MSTIHLGAKRKRTNTPAMAHQRAVSFRHSRYALKNSKSSKNKKLVLENIETIENKTNDALNKEVKKASIFATIGAGLSAFGAAQKKKSEESNKTKKVDNAVKVDKKALRQEAKANKKANKIAAFEAEIQHYIDTPRTSVVGKILRPIFAGYTEAEVKDETVSAYGYGFVLIFIKWILFSGIAFRTAREFIDANAYSIARFNFTDSVILSFEMGLFLFAVELGLYIILSLLSLRTENKVSFSKLMAISMNTCFNPILICVIGYIIMNFNFGIGLAISISSIVLSLIYKSGPITSIIDNKSILNLLVFIIVLVCAFVLFFKYTNLISGSLIEIFNEMFLVK